MKWKNELANCGLTESTVSVGLKNKIKDHYELENAIAQLRETIENPSLNDDVNELQSTLGEIEEALVVSDTKLVEAIQKFNKNKDRYAEMGKHLQRGREQKKNAKSNPAPAQTQNPAPAQKPVTTTPLAETKTESEDDKDKNRGLGWILGTIVLGAVTFGLWNKFRD
jgi:chromosome segregation ATPase